MRSLFPANRGWFGLMAFAALLLCAVIGSAVLLRTRGGGTTIGGDVVAVTQETPDVAVTQAAPDVAVTQAAPDVAVNQVQPGPSQAACKYGSSRRVAAVRTKSLPEASALVASRQWPGTYWTLNDHGNGATLIAFDEQGRSRGTFPVAKAQNVDWEALQLGPGRDGRPALYIGDVGDNSDRRRDAVIYRVPEPRPASADQPAATTPTESVEAYRFVFPDGPHNTEAMLVHPMTGEILFITKSSSGRSEVYRMPRPLDSRRTTTLERLADLNLNALKPRSALVTDASVSPDGRRVALRTYSSVLEYDVPEGASLAEIWGQVPRVAPLDDGQKGESITYRADGLSLMTIGEGSPASLYETPRRC